jgi:hypothetical protein
VKRRTPLAEGFGRGGLEQEGEIRGFSYGQYIHLFFVSPDLDRVGRGVCVCETSETDELRPVIFATKTSNSIKWEMWEDDVRPQSS